MKVITPGHLYELANHERPHAPGQRLQFIQKEQTNPGELNTIADGTTNEEVLRVLIDRLEHLNAKMYSIHNEAALNNLWLALAQLERRTSDRVGRGVEGTPKR